MKLNRDYVLRQVAGMWILIPTGETLVVFRGLIKLNEVGAFLWQKLEEGLSQPELIGALTQTYAISEAKAEIDVAEFLQKLQDNGCLKM